MDIREKLVELLDEARAKRREICYAHTDCNSCVFGEEGENCGDKMIADHLLANGVTVQEWISVDDRLPEVGGYVVCIAKRNPFSRFMPIVARIEKNGWVNPITEQYILEITHWMPMPQPPKGE